MEQATLIALRDFAIDNLPRAQEAREQAQLMSVEQYHYTLYGRTANLGPSASAVELLAADLLQSVLSLLIDRPEEPALSSRQRQLVELRTVRTAEELCAFTGDELPWLSRVPLQSADEPDADPPLPVQSVPQRVLPAPGINLSTKEAARLLGVTPQYMRVWSSKDSGPIRPVKMGVKNGWRSDDVLRLIQEGWKPKGHTK